MRMLLTDDEEYPGYSIQAEWEDWEAKYGDVVDVTDEIRARFEAARDEWTAVQGILGDLQQKALAATD